MTKRTTELTEGREAVTHDSHIFMFTTHRAHAQDFPSKHTQRSVTAPHHTQLLADGNSKQFNFALSWRWSGVDTVWRTYSWRHRHSRGLLLVTGSFSSVTPPTRASLASLFASFCAFLISLRNQFLAMTSERKEWKTAKQSENVLTEIVLVMMTRFDIFWCYNYVSTKIFLTVDRASHIYGHMKIIHICISSFTHLPRWRSQPSAWIRDTMTSRS